ncbi:hypothetical protein GCM10009548_02370 [Streptomyces malaysiensis subsp. malaysiensis]|uniref:Uncharacterized protein n=1 Tax=Streptomyces malaysiensis TaxID=92644 RepID=A0ABX6W937_STRMQ|nr:MULTISPECIES: hypothetical protein [Streptomyces]QPI56306.1 hypothetical protein I1A49_16380 [Streptomyces solisilvae]UHH17790.1 hypothetical protein LUV23_16500 [Streptomyces sp. HNM0561]
MKNLRAKRIGTGYYEVSTPHGTYRVENIPNPKGSGYGSGPNWLIISPGKEVADASKPTKREAMAYIQAICDEPEELPAPDTGPSLDDYATAARYIEQLRPGRWRRSC